MHNAEEWQRAAEVHKACVILIFVCYHGCEGQ